MQKAIVKPDPFNSWIKGWQKVQQGGRERLKDKKKKAGQKCIAEEHKEIWKKGF